MSCKKILAGVSEALILIIFVVFVVCLFIEKTKPEARESKDTVQLAEQYLDLYTNKTDE